MASTPSLLQVQEGQGDFSEKCQNQSSSSIPGRIWQVDLFLGKAGVKRKGDMLNGSEVLVFETFL